MWVTDVGNTGVSAMTPAEHIQDALKNPGKHSFGNSLFLITRPSGKGARATGSSNTGTVSRPPVAEPLSVPSRWAPSPISTATPRLLRRRGALP